MSVIVRMVMCEYSRDGRSNDDNNSSGKVESKQTMNASASIHRSVNQSISQSIICIFSTPEAAQYE